MKRISLICSFLLMLFVSVQAQQAKYVFYFIGDGMGVNQVQGTEMYLSELKGEIGITPLLLLNSRMPPWLLLTRQPME